MANICTDIYTHIVQIVFRVAVPTIGTNLGWGQMYSDYFLFCGSRDYYREM